MTKPTVHFPPRIEWRVRIAHVALAVERIWSLLWPAGGFAGFYLIASLFDVWALIPATLHLFALLGLGAGFTWSLYRGIRSFHRPTRDDAIRRLEDDNGLAHRPLSSYADHIGIGKEDEAAITLWATYRTRLRRQFASVTPGAPRSDLAARDPWAIRGLTVLLLFAGLVVAGADAGQLIRHGFVPGFGSSANAGARLDAWITPPSYTGYAPLFLTDETGDLVMDVGAAGTVQVPQGSELAIRIAGTTDAPVLTGALSDLSVEEIAPQTWSVSGILMETGTISVAAPGGVERNWVFDLIMDIAPEIAFAPQPHPTPLGLIGLPYTLHDDYGVAAVSAELQLVPQPSADGGYRDEFFDDNGEPRDDALFSAADRAVTELALPGPHPRSAEDSPSIDWRAHPWAGREVVLQLAAVDDAGGRGFTRPQIIALPTRVFLNPLAAAVAEQRALLVQGETAITDVVMSLDALTRRADLYLDDLTAYLGLRAAVWSLATRPPVDDVRDAYDILWDLALRLEDGDLSLALDRIRELEQQLLDALSRGASNQEIAALMAALREAIEQYMQAFQNQPADAQAQQQQQAGEQQSMNQNDLQSLLDQIEELAQMGSRQAARELLEGLADMLAQMERAQPQQGGGGMSQQEQALADAVEGLSDLLGGQRQLLDETFRGAQGEDGSPYALTDPWSDWGGWPPPEDWPYGHNLPEESPAAPDGQAPRGTGELAGEQAELMNQLRGLMEQLLEQGVETPGTLGDAQRDMDDSKGALSGGSFAGSVPLQEEAVEALRNALEALAQNLLNQMTERMGGDQSGSASGRDPLGRTSPNQGLDFGDSVSVPTEREMQRARDILEELRRRAGERDRPEIELDYLERLLRRF